MHTYGYPYEVGNKYQPAVGIFIISNIFPFEHGPEGNSGKNDEVPYTSASTAENQNVSEKV